MYRFLQHNPLLIQLCPIPLWTPSSCLLHLSSAPPKSTPPSDISPSYPTTPPNHGKAIRYVGSEEAAATKPGIVSHKPSCPVIFDNVAVPRNLCHVLQRDKSDERLNDGRPILSSPEQRKWKYMNKSNIEPSWYEQGCGQVIKVKRKDEGGKKTSDYIAAYADMEFDFYLTLAAHRTSTTEENTVYTTSSAAVTNPNPNSITTPAPPSQCPVLRYIHPHKVRLPLRHVPPANINATSCRVCIIYSIAHNRAHDATEVQRFNAKHANALGRDGGLMAHLKSRHEMNPVKHDASESGFWGRSVVEVRMKRGLMRRSVKAYVPAGVGAGVSPSASGLGNGKGKGVGKKKGKGTGPALVGDEWVVGGV